MPYGATRPSPFDPNATHGTSEMPGCVEGQGYTTNKCRYCGDSSSGRYTGYPTTMLTSLIRLARRLSFCSDYFDQHVTHGTLDPLSTGSGSPRTALNHAHNHNFCKNKDCLIGDFDPHVTKYSKSNASAHHRKGVKGGETVIEAL